MKSWMIWKRDGFYSVIGKDTGGRIKVIEAEPTEKLVRELELDFKKNTALLGFDFWDKLKQLFELHKE